MKKIVGQVGQWASEKDKCTETICCQGRLPSMAVYETICCQGRLFKKQFAAQVGCQRNNLLPMLANLLPKLAI